MLTFAKIFTGFLLGLFVCSTLFALTVTTSVVLSVPYPTRIPAPTFTPTPVVNSLENIGAEIQRTLLDYKAKQGDSTALSARLKVLGDSYNQIAPVWKMPLFDVPALTQGIVTASPLATPFPKVPGCQCTANVYSCQDFPLPNGEGAQGCFEYCVQLGFGDIHDLDRNSNNLVCED